MNIWQKLSAQSIYLFLECGRYFSDNATSQLESLLAPHQWKRTQSVFLVLFSVTIGASEQFLVEQWWLEVF